MNKQMKSVSGGMLADIKAVESNLAREENRELEKVALKFPEDHPIREEYKKFKSSVGDLANLPSNHPFILMLMDVKKQIEAQENPEPEKQQEEVRQPNDSRAKRQEKQQQQRVQEEEEKAIRQMAAGQVNHQLGRVDKEVANLYATLQGVKEDLANDPYTRSRVVRLERMMAVMKRTLEECKFSNTRMM
jgi:hypothetical protein